MAEARMHHLATVGRFSLYYANRCRFEEPGLHLWTGSRHLRILPLPKRPDHWGDS